MCQCEKYNLKMMTERIDVLGVRLKVYAPQISEVFNRSVSLDDRLKAVEDRLERYGIYDDLIERKPSRPAEVKPDSEMHCSILKPSPPAEGLCSKCKDTIGYNGDDCGCTKPSPSAEDAVNKKIAEIIYTSTDYGTVRLEKSLRELVSIVRAKDGRGKGK